MKSLCQGYGEYVVGLELDVRGDECRNERPRLFSVGLPVGGVDGVPRLRRCSTKWQEAEGRGGLAHIDTADSSKKENMKWNDRLGG